jgi:hypothetical protein
MWGFHQGETDCVFILQAGITEEWLCTQLLRHIHLPGNLKSTELLWSGKFLLGTGFPARVGAYQVIDSSD